MTRAAPQIPSITDCAADADMPTAASWIPIVSQPGALIDLHRDYLARVWPVYLSQPLQDACALLQAPVWALFCRPPRGKGHGGYLPEAY